MKLRNLKNVLFVFSICWNDRMVAQGIHCMANENELLLTGVAVDCRAYD